LPALLVVEVEGGCGGGGGGEVFRFLITETVL
jgi:hypothetical protein